MSSDSEWYWDLDDKIAVPTSERGSSDHVLGPYPTKADAENWKHHVEERNERWDEADDAWEQAGDCDPPTANG